jgi:ParB/RepB/Spo0J family partition protein
MAIISVSAQEKGVGKTIAFHLGGASAAAGRKTLLWGMDPENPLFSAIMNNVHSLPITLRDLLLNPDLKARQAIQKTKFPNMHILPCNPGLGPDERTFLIDPDSQYLLSKKLEEIKNEYELIFIDTPSDLGPDTTTAMVISDYAIIPMECSSCAVKSVLSLLELIIKIKKKANPRLKVLGFVINRVNSTRTIEQTYMGMIRKKFGPHVFQTEIINSVRYLEAIAQGTPITFYEPKSEQAEAYGRLFKEIEDLLAEAKDPVAKEKAMSKEAFLEKIKEDVGTVILPTEQSGISNLTKTKSINNARLIPIGDIIPDPNQPRTTFDQAKLEELAESIKTNGIIEPINVRFIEGQAIYQIVTGERRFRAARIAGINEIPCMIKDINEQEAPILQVIENQQRENLTPIEEATSIKRLLDSGLTQTEISKQIGKSQPYISQTQKLLTLPKSILEEAGTAEISKEQLLQLTKAENPETLWQETKEGKTAKEIRAEVHKGRTSKGRPKNFRYVFAPKQRPYKVLVQFNRPNVEKDEIEEALREALANVEKPFSHTQAEAT